MDNDLFHGDVHGMAISATLCVSIHVSLIWSDVDILCSSVGGRLCVDCLIYRRYVFDQERAYVQGGIAIIVGELLLLAFNKYVTNKYDSIVQDFPVALLEAMPTANLDLQQFMPPSMRDNEDGWFMEHGKAWIFWGAPRYGY